MDLIAYLDVLRRRWALPVAGAIVALLAVWLTLPADGTSVRSTQNYTATSTLVASPSESAPQQLHLVALFARVGQVPERAADRLGFDGDPQVLASMITTAVDPQTITVTLSSNGMDPDEIEARVNVFAEELVEYFRERSSAEAAAQVASLERNIASARRDLRDLDARIRNDPGNTGLLAELNGLRGHAEALVAQVAALENGITAPVEVLQPAVAVPDLDGGPTFSPPSQTRDRLLVGAGLGLLLGFALALVAERLDSRLRSREDLEAAWELPVLAEIPRMPWRRLRSPAVLSATEPSGASAEAHRSLRSDLLLARPLPRHREQADVVPEQPAVFLVTSALPAEGKTTTVANLAVVMAETGRNVLVLSLDLRNPRIEDLLDVPAGAGISDLLSARRPQDLAAVTRATAFAGVSLATSGQETSHPGALLTGAAALLDEARRQADVVLVDAPPLLGVSDTLDLAVHVDAVLVVARPKRATRAQARAARRLLTRLGIRALGTAIVGGDPPSLPDSYYPQHLPRSRRLGGLAGLRSGATAGKYDDA